MLDWFDVVWMGADTGLFGWNWGCLLYGDALPDGPVKVSEYIEAT